MTEIAARPAARRGAGARRGPHARRAERGRARGARRRRRRLHRSAGRRVLRGAQRRRRARAAHRAARPPRGRSTSCSAGPTAPTCRSPPRSAPAAAASCSRCGRPVSAAASPSSPPCPTSCGSPLTSVKGYTSLMLNRWDRLKDEQKRTMLEQVHHDADRVTRLVTELLDISRLETGRLVLRRQMVDLPALAAPWWRRWAWRSPSSTARVVFPAGPPPRLRRPRQGRAGAHQPGRERRQVRQPQGDAGHRRGRTTACVAVAVRDTGEGIPPEDLPRVFTKFFRRDHGRPTGTGLGLWISQGLVEAHGGTLTADLDARRGQHLPVHPPHRRLRAGASAAEPIGEPPPERGASLFNAAGHRRHRGRRRRRASRRRRRSTSCARSTRSCSASGRRCRRSSRSSAASIADERREVGGALNRVREALEAALSARRAELEAVARRAQLAAERLDLTEVPPDRGAGHLHLVTQAMRDARGRVHRHGLHHRRGSRGGDRLAQLRRPQLPARPPGPRHVRHALRGDGRARLHRAAHAHLAGAGARDDAARSRPSTW